MTTIALEGTGASIAFATSEFTADLITLTLPSQSRESIDTTHLGTVGAKTSKPAKLKDVGSIEIEVDHDPSADRLIGAEPEEITISYPLQDGETTPAKLVFTGYVVNEGGEEFKVDDRMRTKMTIKVSGDMEPVAPT